MLLNTYHSKEIIFKYIIYVVEKGFMIVDYLSKVYGIPDTHKCIDKNLSLHLILNINVRQKSDLMNPELLFLDKYKIIHKDLLFKILITCANIIYFNLKHLVSLNAFTLANSSNANKCS